MPSSTTRYLIGMRFSTRRKGRIFRARPLLSSSQARGQWQRGWKCQRDYHFPPAVHAQLEERGRRRPKVFSSANRTRHSEYAGNSGANGKSEGPLRYSIDEAAYAG